MNTQEVWLVFFNNLQANLISFLSFKNHAAFPESVIWSETNYLYFYFFPCAFYFP